MMLLEGRIQNYAWGSVDAIASILGVDPTGQPQAELWLGAHGIAPSDLPELGTDLNAWLGDHPDALGSASMEQFGARLPFLLKVLSAAQPLSLQAHPNREQAQAGFADENARGLALTDPQRSFKDDWPKPEMVLALTDFSTLTGFRPATQTAALFAGLGVGTELAPVLGPLTQRSGSAALAEVFLDVLSLSEQRRNLVELVVAAAMRHVDDDTELGAFARTAVDLDDHYPGDRSILAALLLNRLDLKPGQAVHLSPGNMHAHLKGTCVEVMASSDNVLRGGLTPKHIDVDALVQVVDFDGGPPELVKPDTSTPGLVHYRTPSPEFDLWTVNVGGGGQPARVGVPATANARILLVLDGYLACASTDETTELVRGQSAFIPAGEVVRVHGDAEAVLASAGV